MELLKLVLLATPGETARQPVKYSQAGFELPRIDQEMPPLK